MFRVWLCLLTILGTGFSIRADEVAPPPREAGSSLQQTVTIEFTKVRVPKSFLLDLGIEDHATCSLTPRELKMVLTAMNKSPVLKVMNSWKAIVQTSQKATIQSGNESYEAKIIPLQGQQKLHFELFSSHTDPQNQAKNSTQITGQMPVGNSLMIGSYSVVETQTTENKLPWIGYPRWRTKQTINLDEYVIVTPKLDTKE
jgi:hypothetical protein